MEIKKAITFRASSIGDCLMGKYLLENIHAQFPSARLGIVVASRAGMIRDLFAAYPWLEVIEANRRDLRSLFYLWKNFRKSNLVVTQYTGKPSGRFSLGSKFFARMLAKRGGFIGFTDVSWWNGILYDRLVPIRADVAVVEHDREALRIAGIPIALPFPTLHCVEDERVLSKFGLEKGNFIVVHLFAGNAGRGLHPDNKRELLALLAQKLPHMHLVVSGSPNDREEALRVTEGTSARVIAGEATLQEMMKLIRHSRAVVSVDTGMAHISAQLGVSLIVMRTCLGRNWWFPEQYGSDAPITVFECDTVCKDGHLAKNYPDCINAISVENIAREMSTHD